MIVLITILLKMSKNEVMVRVKVFPNSNKTNVSSYVHNLVFSKLIACINQSKTHFVIFCKKWCVPNTSDSLRRVASISININL